MVRSHLVICVVALAAAGPALAGKAHEHGTAQLDIAVAAGRVSIDFETPLDNLLGFEREPRTDAERQRADAAVAQLRAADRLFRIDPAAGCTLAKVETRRVFGFENPGFQICTSRPPCRSST